MKSAQSKNILPKKKNKFTQTKKKKIGPDKNNQPSQKKSSAQTEKVTQPMKTETGSLIWYVYKIQS